MAVADPCCKKEWGEWKREMEEKRRRRRWTEKVSCWANLEVSDSEEEEEEEEAIEREMRVKVRWSEKEGEVVEWEEGEDDGDGLEPQLMEEDGGNEAAIEEGERAMDGEVEEGLIKADDDEEEQQLEQTGERDRMEQEQERPEDEMEEEDRGAEPQVMEEDEQTEGENELRERVGAAAKVRTGVQAHADEERRELEQSGENNLSERDNDERSETDEDEGADDDREEDWYKDRMIDEERAEIPNEQNHENSLVEGHRKDTEARPPTDDLKDPEEEEESDEEEASQEDIVDEDVVKTYCVDGHPSEMFSALRDLREAALLTDLTLSTADGSRLRVHAAVLAAVSSRVRRRLRERPVENSGIHVCLGPEVDGVGLAAVVEFAYAGFISALGADAAPRVRAAAAALGARRVTELCGREEAAPGKPGEGQKEERALAEQRVTLRAIEKMRTDKVGCDVVLEAIGGRLRGE